MTQTTPPSKYGIRLHRIAVSAVFFLAGFVFASWASRIPDIKNQLHLSDGQLGSLLLCLPIGLTIGLPVAGLLVSKWGSRKVIAMAAVMYPLILILLGLSSNIWQLSIALFFFGFFGNQLNIAVNTQAVGVEELYGRSVMASFHGVWSLAGFAGAMVSTLMVANHLAPWIHFVINASAVLLLLFTTYRYTLAKDKGGNQQQPLFVKPDNAILLLGIISFGCLVCEGTMFDWSGVYFDKVVDASTGFRNAGYVAFMSSMATGRFIADKLVARLGVITMLRGSGIIIACGILTAVAFPTPVAATIGFFLTGLGVSSVVPLVYGLAGKSTTMQPGVAIAALTSIGFLGFLAGPPFVGFIAEAFNLRVSFAVVACLGLTTSLLAGKIKA